METDPNRAKEIRSKAQRLVEYLIEIACLRSALIRNIEEYERFLWLHEIPKEPEYCFTQAWGPELAAQLKRRCGTGGSVKDGIIIIQGDHREALLSELKKQGFTAKIAGG